MRQFESSYYDKEKIDQSTRRLKRTQYFEGVDIKTVSVPGISDQVDLTVAVKEKNTGSVKLVQVQVQMRAWWEAFLLHKPIFLGQVIQFQQL